MAIRKCKECGGLVSTKAKACPSCGAPVKQEVSAAAGCLSLIVIGVVIAAFAGVFNDKGKLSSPGSSPSAKEWHEGGTLHRKTMADWRKAPYADRLATAADIIAATAKARNFSFSSIEELKPHAVRLEREISIAGEDGTADSLKVAEIAAVVMVLMDHPNASQ